MNIEIRELQEIYSSFEKEIQKIERTLDDTIDLGEKINQFAASRLSLLPSDLRNRIQAEYSGYGPLASILDDESITEILINGPSHIFFEKNGKLHGHPDQFLSEISYKNFVDRICEESKCHATVETPFADGQFGHFRFCLVRHEITQRQAHISLRRHPDNPWTLDRLHESGWCSEKEKQMLQNLMSSHKSFLVVGQTSSGKTSVTNALLQNVETTERVVVIEDSNEVKLPNKCSMKMLTREDPHGCLPTCDQSRLLKQALRLRPDRIIIGEIRGSEAKDFLMLLSTGHGGSFGTLHAADPRQALLRLEMLIQSGSNWNLQAVRKLIHLSLEYIVVTGRSPAGKRQFQGLYQLSSLEENGFLLEKVEMP